MTKSAGASATSHSDAVKLAMRQFLASKNTGCVFAHHFATLKNGPIDWIIDPPLDKGIASRLDLAIDTAAKTSHAAVVVFSTIEGLTPFVDMLALLALGSRWTFTERLWKRELSNTDILVGIDWRTSDDHVSSVMGLARFATMPIYRRAPYVGLALWPGGHENEYWEPSRADLIDVGFIDMPTGLRSTATQSAKERHAEMKSKSHKQTRALKSLPRSEAGRPDVAFALPASARERLTRDCNMTVTWSGGTATPT